METLCPSVQSSGEAVRDQLTLGGILRAFLPEVTTVRHDRGQHGADVFRRRLLALSGREEIAGKAKLIVDFDQEVGQLHTAHLLCQPGFKAGQTKSIDQSKTFKHPLIIQFEGSGLRYRTEEVLCSK